MHPHEITHAMVAAQLSGMGAASYEVGIHDQGRMRPWTGPADALLRRVPELLAWNERGANIYVRPAHSIGLILLDDVTREAIPRMQADGAAPAVVVETSPRNYQAWVCVARGQLPRDLVTALARLLCDRYGGDRNAAHVRQYGRLAGFTNRKEKHRRADGLYPQVVLRAAWGYRAPAADALLAEARQRQQEGPAIVTSARPVRVDPSVMAAAAADAPTDLSPLGRLYQLEARRLLRRYPAVDASRLDWMIVVSLVHTFVDAEALDLERAMIEGSPALAERKAGHVADYVRRTVRKALLERRDQGYPYQR